MRSIRRSWAAPLAVLLVLLIGGGTASAANDLLVAPFEAGTWKSGYPTDATSAKLRRVLTNTNKYALATWWSAKGYAAQSGAYLELGGGGEPNIRPPASEAYALATSIATGSYDSSLTGVSEAEATTIAVKLIKSVARHHVANEASGWGNGWQTAYWAALDGTAGWLLWGDLSATDREYVRKMVAYEANRFIGYQVPYLRDLAGTILTPGDSKGEEDAWNARLMMLAVIMMPQHSRHAAWLYEAGELGVAAFSRQADLTNSTEYSGLPARDWLYGSNLESNGAMVNHCRIAPDYTATLPELFAGAAVNSLAHHSTPQLLYLNAANAYHSLVAVDWSPSPLPDPCPSDTVGFQEPPSTDPGGTMYIPGSGDVYYPQPNDWGTSRRAQFTSMDGAASVFGFDNLVSSKGEYWENLHAQEVLEMQERFTDGRTYGSTTEDNYSGREEWVAAQTANAWLMLWARYQNAVAVSTNPYPLVYDDNDRQFSVIGGNWTKGSPAVNGPEVMGPTTRYTAAGTGSSQAEWTPRLTTTHTYKVYGWWNAYGNHATDTPYTINYVGGSKTVRVNQQINGNQWVLLGTFNLGAGSSVVVSNDANGYVTADAIMLER